MRCAKLGYSDEQVDAIVAHINEHKTIFGAPHFKAEHLPVFACSMGDNTIHYMGHVKMMGAVQPFISGAISKTVNMPEDVDGRRRRGAAHRGVAARPEGRRHLPRQLQGRAAARHAEEGRRDRFARGAGRSSSMPAQVVERIVEHVIVQEPVRQKLPRMRNSKTFSFRVADCHGYATVGEFEDGRPGEVFLKVAKQGSTLAGIMDAFAISVSLGLQYGVPLEAFVEKFTNMRFEPAGMTDDPDLRIATSLVDYIFRRLGGGVPRRTRTRRDMGVLTVGERTQPTLPGVEEAAIANEPALRPCSRSTTRRRRRRSITPASDAAAHAGHARDCARRRRCSATSAATSCSAPARCHACPSCGATSGCS